MCHFKICIIEPSFIDKHPSLKKEANSKENRIYLGIKIKINDNNYFIPFETKLFKHPRLVGVSQYPVPSNKRPNAGLNFEKCLVINDSKYIKKEILITEAKMSNKQKSILKNNEKDITNKFNLYIKKYITACKKNREKREFIFKYSTLHEFKDELNI